MRLFSWFSRREKHKKADSSTLGDEETLYKQVQDRTYLKNAPDMFPRDMQEVNRLDFQYYIVRNALRGNILAPLTQANSIIDIGCGTGRWAIDVAKMLPQTRVFGLDIDPMVSNGEHIPANYQFVKGDVTKALPFPDQCFDYVHQQLISGSIPAALWPHALQELTRITRVGGWVELVETDIYMQNMGPQLQQLTRWCVDACNRLGIDLRIGLRLQNDLQALGLAGVHGRPLEVPMGNWGGRVGKTTGTALVSLYQALKPIILSQTDVSNEQFERTLAAMQNELDSTRSSAVFYVACGQRVY